MMEHFIIPRKALQVGQRIGIGKSLFLRPCEQTWRGYFKFLDFLVGSSGEVFRAEWNGFVSIAF